MKAENSLRGNESAALSSPARPGRGQEGSGRPGRAAPAVGSNPRHFPGGEVTEGVAPSSGDASVFSLPRDGTDLQRAIVTFSPSL